MSDNIITKREVFEQIVKLQEQMLNNSNALQRMVEAVEAICTEEIDMDGDERQESIDSVCTAFMQRDAAIRHMLETYQNIYNDIKD